MSRDRAALVLTLLVAAAMIATNVGAEEPGPQGFEGAEVDIFGHRIATLTGHDFRMRTETGDYTMEHDGCIRAPDTLSARIDVPDGSRVVAVRPYVRDADGLADWNFEVREYAKSSGADGYVSFQSFTGATSGTPGWDEVELESQSTAPGDLKSSRWIVITATPGLKSSTLQLCQVSIHFEPPTSGGTEFHAISPCAVFDTRAGTTGDFTNKLAPGETISIDVIKDDHSTQGGVGTSCGLPEAPAFDRLEDQGATIAIALNLVALNATGPGNLKAWQWNLPEPDGGVLNYNAGDPNSNEFPLGVSPGAFICAPFPDCFSTDGGDIRIKNNGAAHVHVRGVVVGYYTYDDSNQ